MRQYIGSQTRTKAILVFISLICIVITTACTPENTHREQVLINQSEWLKDGEAISYKLETGTYEIEMTASGDGAGVEWVGVSCPGVSETKSFSIICAVPAMAQIVIKNPTVLGLGDPSSVFIRVTQLIN